MGGGIVIFACFARRKTESGPEEKEEFTSSE
jgi:hypothetical protein